MALQLDQEKSPYRISLPVPNRSSSIDLLNGRSAWLEIRLFYVRIAPCVVDIVPDHLTFRLLRRETGCSLKINDAPIPASEVASLVLRRDHLSKDSSEVTYVCTDGVRVAGGVEFEAYEGDKVVLLSGSLERMEADWSIDCFLSAAAMSPDKSKFMQPKMGVSAPGIEVYIAGCCSGAPVILARTIMVSPRRNTGLKHGCLLDAIPEDGEMGEDGKKTGGGVAVLPRRELQIREGEDHDYQLHAKIGQRYYQEEIHASEDGELTLFNAGVRVGVGIGLGMCIGVGVGVGLLMRSYQATSRSFRRRFF